MAVTLRPAGDRHADLLPLALSRPNEALQRARAVLAGDPSPLDASIARQAIGTVLREYGDIETAIGELRIARRRIEVATEDHRCPNIPHLSKDPIQLRTPNRGGPMKILRQCASVVGQ